MRFRYVHIIAALFLLGGMGFQFFFSYRRASTRVQERMDLEMQVAQEKLLFELYDAYNAVYQLEDFMADDMNNPTDLLDETREIMKLYPHFFTFYVAYPPYAFPAKGKWYGLRSYRVRDSISSNVFGGENHNYFEREWWRGALESGRSGFWSQPYHDNVFDEPIFTYSNDYHDKKNNVTCVIGVDFSVNWVQQLLEQFKPFDEVNLAVYSSSGTLLTSSTSQDSTLFNVSNAQDRFAGKDWVVSRKTLNPIDIDLVMAVPKSYVWESIRVGILVPFAVFILGILVVAYLIHRISRDERENIRLGAEQKVIAHELVIAHGIQMGILKNRPLKESKNPAGEQDIDLHAILLPMREVGGDLYDFHREGDTIWFIIGDVSGKGVPAAMFMSAVVNLFRAIGRRSHTPKQIMEEMNSVLSENNPSLTFVTAFIGRLHIPSGQLLFCNAGHCPPLIVESGASSVKRVQLEPNIPLGYDGRYSFAEEGCILGEGEKLVLYTDGVTEARNSKGEMLGMSRLSALAGGDKDLLAAIKQYIGDAEPTDDITLMTIRKTDSVRPVSLRVVNQADQWPVLRQAIHEYGICVGIEKRTLKKLEVASEEAVVNIVRYSQATKIEMALSLQNSAFSIQLSDDGVAFDPTAHEVKTDAVEERQIGGMGISLIRQIADEVHYERVNEKNVLTIAKSTSC